MRLSVLIVIPTIMTLTFLSALPAVAATTFTQVSLSAVVTGTSVRASGSVKASTSTTVRDYGISIEPTTNNADIVYVHDRVISTVGTNVSGTLSNLAPGTYRYELFLRVNTRSAWILQVGPQKTFTVRAASATPEPTPPVPPASSMPVGDLPGWKQTFAEDFTKPAALGQLASVYDNGLRGYDGFGDTSGHGTYAPDKVLSVHDGSLDYYLHSEGGRPLVAAPILNDWSGQTYGRYSVRFRADHLPGYKIAFLLWPSSNDWNEGEIDWPEGNLTTGTRMSPASAKKGTYSNGQMQFDPPSRVYAATDSRNWHVATTEWTPGLVKWFWDGALVGQTTIPAGVPTSDFRWTLQAETALDGPSAASATAGHLLVDWAASYTRQ